MDINPLRAATALVSPAMYRGTGTWRLLFGFAVVVMGVVAVISAYSPAAEAADEPCTGADCDVVTDPEDAEYVGTGGLLLPSDSFTGSSDDRTAAATCEECRWALLPMCREGTGDGVACGPAARSCPPGTFRRIVLLLRPGAPDWEEIGLVCLDPTGPVTIDDVAAELSDVVVEEAPPLKPGYQPRGGTLVQLPAVFDSGQPSQLGRREFNLVGFEVVLQGRATWTWDFGDGEQLTTEQPGGVWPNDSVAHTYTSAGQYPVVVTTEWQAWFTVDGLGPYPVEGPPVIQVGDPLVMQVHEARAELISG